jgi:ATP-binding cassette subfamily B protein
LLSLLIPEWVGQAIDSIRTGSGRTGHFIGLLVAVALVMACFRFAYREFLMGTTRRLEHDLRERIFSHALLLPMSRYDEAGPGQIMALAVNDVTAVRVAVGLGVMLSVDAGVMGLASFLYMFARMDPLLTLYSIAPLPIVFAGTAILGRMVHHRFRRVQEQFALLTETVQEVFSGVRVVKGFGAEGPMSSRFEAASRGHMEANLSLARIQAVYSPVTHVGPMFCYAIAIFGCGRRVMAGTMTIGDLSAFLGYLSLIIWPIMGIGYLINTVQRGSASWKRIRDFMNTPVHETESAVIPVTGSLRGEIDFRDFSFQYPTAAQPSLQNISLHIPAGSTIGIVGRTGAGKTTLLKSILRMYPLQEGQLFLDGAEINSIEFSKLRSSIGYVPQDTGLFAETIAANIDFGRGLDRDTIIWAARMAAVKEDVDSRAEGFATELGEKGVRLSGGQRQRVAVARALACHPSILLLDDVFSALDYRTQNELVKNLKQLQGEGTMLLVSQRVAAVKDADMILVLEDGLIAESGTHEALLSKRGVYFRIYEQQLVSEGSR